MSLTNPFTQFQIKPLIHMNAYGFDISFTNSSLFMVIAVILTLSMFYLATRKLTLVPSRLQNFSEIIYNLVSNMVLETSGSKGKKFVPLIFSIFIFILMCNLLGMVPYSFTVTSHIIVTFAVAMFLFIVINIIAFSIHGIKFFKFFLPAGTPYWLMPLMILIEIFTYLSRPFSLSIRLAANMVAGHVLLKVLAAFIIMLGIFWGFIPIPFIILLTGFEIFIAILQAYIFTILTCVYLSDAIHLNH